MNSVVIEKSLSVSVVYPISGLIGPTGPSGGIVLAKSIVSVGNVPLVSVPFDYIATHAIILPSSIDPSTILSIRTRVTGGDIADYYITLEKNTVLFDNPIFGTSEQNLSTQINSSFAGTLTVWILGFEQ